MIQVQRGVLRHEHNNQPVSQGSEHITPAAASESNQTGFCSNLHGRRDAERVVAVGVRDDTKDRNRLVWHSNFQVWSEVTRMNDLVAAPPRNGLSRSKSSVLSLTSLLRSIEAKQVRDSRVTSVKGIGRQVVRICKTQGSAVQRNGCVDWATTHCNTKPVTAYLPPCPRP